MDIYGFDYNTDVSKRPWLLDSLFDRYRWYRKLCGGHWERWYIDVVHSRLWIQVARCTHERCVYLPEWEARPPLARGTSTCEDW